MVNLVEIPLNTLPGLEALPDEVTISGYADPNQFVPTRNPNYVFRLEDVRVLVGFLNSDSPDGLMLHGDHGSGKSSVVHQFHAYINRPLFYISGHRSLEFEDLLGQKEIIGGDTQTLDGPLLQAAQYPYATFLLEEVDRAPSQVSVALNPILDGYPIVNTLDSGNRVVTGEGFNVMFTSNTCGNGDMTGSYNSAVVMDKSFLDRVLAHEIWYPSPDQEFAILRKAVDTNVGDDLLRRSISFANDVRYIYSERTDDVSDTAKSLGVSETIDDTISTRALIRIWQTMLMFPNVDQPIIYALKLAVTSKCTREGAEAIEQIAQAHFASDPQ